MKVKRNILPLILVIVLLINAAAFAQAMDGRLKKAQIYVQNGEYKNAKEILERMIKGGDAGMDVYFLLGLSQLGLKEYEGAEASFVRILQIDNHCEPAYVQLAATQIEMKKYNEAERSLNNLLKVNPKSAVGHYALGVVHYNKNDMLKASKEFNEAILCDKEFAPAYANLGVIYYNREQFKDSLQNFAKAAGYEKLEPSHLFNAGWVARTMGEKEKSYSYFRRSSNLKAPSVYSVTWKIIQAYDKGDMKKVKEHLKELGFFDKEFDKGKYFQVLVLKKEKKYKEASEILKKMLEENPRDYDARQQMKEIKPLLGQEEKTETTDVKTEEKKDDKDKKDDKTKKEDKSAKEDKSGNEDSLTEIMLKKDEKKKDEEKKPEVKEEKSKPEETKPENGKKEESKDKKNEKDNDKSSSDKKNSEGAKGNENKE